MLQMRAALLGHQYVVHLASMCKQAMPPVKLAVGCWTYLQVA